MQRKKGISLIVLVITIIVMIVLAGTIIITLSNSGIINRSNEAVFKQNIKNYQSELALYLADELSVNPKYDYKTLNADNTTTPNITDIIKSINEEDKTEFIVHNGELIYVGLDKNKKAWAEEVGIKTQLPDRPLTEAEYNEVYKAEIAMACKYGKVEDGMYRLNEGYNYNFNGSSMPLPEEAHVLALPYGTTNVETHSFWGQPITRIIFPQTMESIAGYTFTQCTSLTKVEGLEYVRLIGTYAFSGCKKLTQIELSPQASLGYAAFSGIGIENINITSEKQLDGAFTGCLNLKSVNIQEGVKTIGYEAFSWCTNLTNVSLPESLEEIGSAAFAGCNINNLVLPSKIKRIADNALSGCTLKSSLLPDSITYIGNYSALPKNTKLNIPTSIEWIGYNAFNSKEVIWNGWDNLTYIEDNAFENATGFSGQIMLPETLTNLGLFAFSNSDITSIKLPSSINRLNYRVFANCTKLESVIIPKSISTVQLSVFSGCTALTNVYYEGTETEWKAVTIEEDNEALTNANITYNYAM